MQRDLFPSSFSSLQFAFLSGSVFAQSIEGKVELPKPATERGENQRYQGFGEVPQHRPSP